jgi:chromosome segregation ATPase
MASHDFQESFKNYQDLDELREKLEQWSADLVVYEDMIRRRRAHYEPLLPAIDREFKALEAEWRSHAERRDRIARQLESLRVESDPELLVTSEERDLLEQLDRLEQLVTPSTEKVASTFFDRLRRLRGVLYWNTHAEYDARLANAEERLRDLDQELDRLRQQVEAVAIARRTAVESYEGHDDVIRRERQRITEEAKRVQELIAQQGQVLEIMAESELTSQRERLDDFRVKARFALADSYDRAGKAQGRKKNEP